jgi:hypothetical protein
LDFLIGGAGARGAVHVMGFVALRHGRDYREW